MRVLKVIEGTEVVQKVETDFLMNTVTAVTNTNVHVLFFSPLCKCLTFFFFNTFSHLARSKCCKWSLLVKMCFLHFLSPSFIFHLPSSISSLPCCSSLSLHIYSCYLSHCLPPPFPASCLLSFFLSLSLAGWFILLSALCRYTLGRAPLLWTGYVWAYLLQRWVKWCWIPQAPFQAYSVWFAFVLIRGLSCVYTFDCFSKWTRELPYGRNYLILCCLWK